MAFLFSAHILRIQVIEVKWFSRQISIIFQSDKFGGKPRKMMSISAG
jgi:hypothetical protein